MRIKKKYNKILILGDIHTPFADMELIRQAWQYNKSFNADLVICTGDMLDQKAFSKYPKSPEDDGPAVEWEKALDQCWEIESYFPNMIILGSNHDRRYMKKASEAGLPKLMIKTLKELIPIKGWHWHLGPEPLVLNGNIACLHGDELQGAPIVKATKLGMNVIQGHTHQASLQYLQTFQKQLWAVDPGCMVDKQAAAFDYAASSLTKVFTGFGIVQDNVPQIIPKKCSSTYS